MNMRKNKPMISILIILLGLTLIFSASCDAVIERVKENAIKILEEKTTKVDSTLYKEIDNTINEVDTLLNHKNK